MNERTLAVDIGGSGIKALILDAQGMPLTARLRVVTPKPAPPELVLTLIAQMAVQLGSFERASVGFPGVVQQGRVRTAHLDPQWIDFALDVALAERLQCPVRVANDADIQGLGTIVGQGVELVLTLGTGLGSALFIEGQLVPNLQLAHQPFQAGQTYEAYLGSSALKTMGSVRWNSHLAQALSTFEKLFNFSYAYLGGGNSKFVSLPLPAHIRITPNENGLLGGIALWR